MARGGYREPGNPAPVSGPGALSRRTDGPQGGGQQPVRVPTGGPYGEAQNLQQLQQAAPLAASEGGAAAGGLLEQLGVSEGPGGGEPTQQPDVPVTSGAAMGAGPGMEALGLPNQRDEDLKALLAYLPVWEHMASQPGSSKAARNLVRQLKAMQ